MVIGAVVATLLFPGIGHAITGRSTLATTLWAVAGVLSFLPAIFYPAAIGVVLVVRIAAAVDTARVAATRGTSIGGIVVATLVGAVAPVILIRGSGQMFDIPSSSMVPTLQVGDHVFVDSLTPRLRAPRVGDLVVFAMPCDPSRDYDKRVVALAGDTVEIRCDVLYLNGAAQAEELVDADYTYEDRGFDAADIIHRNARRFRASLGGTTFELLHNHDGADGPDKDFPRLGYDFPPSCSNQAFGVESQVASNQLPGEIIHLPRSVNGVPPEVSCDPIVAYRVPAGHVFVLGDSRNNSNDSRFWGSVPVENIHGIVRGVWWPLSRFGSVH